MNPTHPDACRSVGLHLFQELSTLGQQLADALLLRWASAEKGPCAARHAWPDHAALILTRTGTIAEVPGMAASPG